MNKISKCIATLGLIGFLGGCSAHKYQIRVMAPRQNCAAEDRKSNTWVSDMLIANSQEKIKLHDRMQTVKVKENPQTSIVVHDRKGQEYVSWNHPVYETNNSIVGFFGGLVETMGQDTRYPYLDRNTFFYPIEVMPTEQQDRGLKEALLKEDAYKNAESRKIR